MDDEAGIPRSADAYKFALCKRAGRAVMLTPDIKRGTDQMHILLPDETNPSDLLHSCSPRLYRVHALVYGGSFICFPRLHQHYEYPLCGNHERQQGCSSVRVRGPEELLVRGSAALVLNRSNATAPLVEGGGGAPVASRVGRRLPHNVQHLVHCGVWLAAE